MGKKIPSTLVDSGGSSYASERKIYPRDISGRFDRLRRLAVFVLLGLYYLVAWLRWDGRQAVLFDLPARKFHVFALTFWPQDFIFLSGLLIILALSLFFFTALAGRLWCGYACPQTVWTEVFLAIERWTEGDRGRRMKLDAGPWTREKWLRKGSKHVLWVALGLWTGFTFVGYFTPIGALAARLPALEWNAWETFWVLFYGLATWGNAGFLREQVCKYMCPYARFQSAMFDRNTLIIAYDPQRGEPRGARKRGLVSVLERARGLIENGLAHAFVASAGQSAIARARASGTITFDQAPLITPVVSMPEELGDCIDCTLCVQVCPTGIDIRNGLQYECIACGLCIDACDSVMDKVGYPRGLIRYSTQNAVDGKPARVLRPRILIYAALLALLAAAWAFGVAARAPLIADLLRDRNALYRVTADGVSNGYTLKLVNKLAHVQTLEIKLASNTGGIELVGGVLKVELGAEEVRALPIELTAPAAAGRQPVQLRIDTADGSVQQTLDSSFFGPSP